MRDRARNGEDSADKKEFTQKKTAGSRPPESSSAIFSQTVANMPKEIRTQKKTTGEIENETIGNPYGARGIVLRPRHQPPG